MSEKQRIKRLEALVDNLYKRLESLDNYLGRDGGAFYSHATSEDGYKRRAEFDKPLEGE